MKRFSIYGIVLLTAIGIVFFSMRFVSSKDITIKSTARDTIQQGNSPTVVNPTEVNTNTGNKCGKCCCCNKGGEKKCSKEVKNGEDVEIGKNPHLNNPDTTKSNIVPQEDKK